MTHRESIIAQLLEQHHALVDPMQSRNGTGDGEPLPLMPPTYTLSVRELERLIGEMRARALRGAVAYYLRGPEETVYLCDNTAADALQKLRRNPGVDVYPLGTLRAHAIRYYVQAETVIRHPQLQLRPNKHKRQLIRQQLTDDGKPVPVFDKNRPKNANRRLAELGVKWLAGEWRLEHEPMLPRELVSAA